MKVSKVTKEILPIVLKVEKLFGELKNAKD